MDFNRYTRNDLIWIINRLITSKRLREHDLDVVLNDLAYEKEKKQISEAEKYAKLADEKRRAYIELLNPYDGMQFINIPKDVLEDAISLQKEAEEADRKFEKLLGIKGGR